MSYEAHIERAGGIPLDEWLAVAPGERVTEDHVVSMGAHRMVVPAGPGDVRLEGGAWLRWRRGRVSVACPADFDDPSTALRVALRALADALGAQVVGDEGEVWP